MRRNKSKHLLLLNRPLAIAASLTAAITNVKVTVPKTVAVLVYQRSSRGRRERSREGRKRAKRRPTILQMEGEEIRVAKTKAPIL
jgi:hypothetical protein